MNVEVVIKKEKEKCTVGFFTTNKLMITLENISVNFELFLTMHVLWNFYLISLELTDFIFFKKKCLKFNFLGRFKVFFR